MLNFKYLLGLVLMIQNSWCQSSQTERQRSLSGSAPIRMKADFSNIDGNIELDDQLKYKIKALVRAALEIIPTYVEVLVPETNNIVFSSLSLDVTSLAELVSQYKIPESHQDQDVGIEDCDLMLWVDTTSSDQLFLAQSSGIQLSLETRRPVIGYIVYNIKEGLLDQFQSQLQTTLHEITHVLGFYYQLFEFYPNQPVFTKIDGRTYITTPKVVEFAKAHINCQSDIVGVPLEDAGTDGSAGSHWEASFIRNELMTSQNIGGLVITKLTLGLLEDSGWYKIDFSFAEESSWGKNRGCNFMKCSDTFPEFCSEADVKDSKEGIDFFFQGPGLCQKQIFDDCPVYYPYLENCLSLQFMKENQAQIFQTLQLYSYSSTGPNTASFYSTILRKKSGFSINYNYRCYQYAIDADSISIKLEQDAGQIVCTKEEAGKTKTLDNNLVSGIIKCPPVEIWDRKKITCGDKCRNLGYCHSGSCTCFQGAFLNQNGECNCGDLCEECGYLSDVSIIQCVKCLEGYVLEGEQCFKNTNCKQQFCDLCKDDSSCYRCFAPYSLQDKVCQSDCNFNFYSKNQACFECNDRCKGCGSETYCFGCQQSYYPFVDKDQNTMCLTVEECNNTGKVLVKNQCLKCDISCSQCNGAGPTDVIQEQFYCFKKKCDSCSLDSPNYYLNEGLCVKDCPANTMKYIEDHSNTMCILCSGFLIIKNNLVECVASCPDNLFIQEWPLRQLALGQNYGGICLQCQPECIKCTASICSKCLPKYYLDVKILCSPCPDKCESCVNSHSCESCDEFSVLIPSISNPSIMQCVEKTTPCLSSEFENTDGICNPCSKPCKTCISLENCRSCDDNLVFFNSKCVEKCREDQNTIGECRHCGYKCQTCKGPQVDDCLSCKDDIQISKEGQCSPSGATDEREKRIYNKGELYNQGEMVYRYILMLLFFLCC